MNPADPRNTTVVTPTHTGLEKAREAKPSSVTAAPPAPRRREERPLPASVMTPPPPPPPPHLDDYKSIIGQAEIDALRFLANDLKGRSSRW